MQDPTHMHQAAQELLPSRCCTQSIWLPWGQLTIHTGGLEWLSQCPAVQQPVLACCCLGSGLATIQLVRSQGRLLASQLKRTRCPAITGAQGRQGALGGVQPWCWILLYICTCCSSRWLNRMIWSFSFSLQLPLSAALVQRPHTRPLQSSASPTRGSRAWEQAAYSQQPRWQCLVGPCLQTETRTPVSPRAGQEVHGLMYNMDPAPGVVGPEEVGVLLLQLLPDQVSESWLDACCTGGKRGSHLHTPVLFATQPSTVPLRQQMPGTPPALMHRACCFRVMLPSHFQPDFQLMMSSQQRARRTSRWLMYS